VNTGASILAQKPCTRLAWHADSAAMIDFATILFTTIMCLIVMFRAIRLDGQIPWFGKPGAFRPPMPPQEDPFDAP
jgi:hypothetical protein